MLKEETGGLTLAAQKETYTTTPGVQRRGGGVLPQQNKINPLDTGKRRDG